MTNTAHSSPMGILYKLFLAASPLVTLMAMADESIQARLDAASKAGGGVVEVCAGLHESSALVLKSGVTLRLAEGAVLKAKTAFEAFAPTEGHACSPSVSADRPRLPLSWGWCSFAAEV